MSHDEHKDFGRALESAVASFGLEALTEEQAKRLTTHYLMLCRWNQRVNLTRIIEPEEAARLHYSESLFGARFIAHERTLLDIGSGAGFPAIPIAIARPDVQVTGLEANSKKSLFLKEAREALALTNFNVVTARLEDFNWPSYELLTSRALERSEAILSSVIERLTPHNRLMLFCAPDLLGKLEGHVTETIIETHRIPLSGERLVAIFTRRII
ncbi:MAG TPA: 16S rRNA (guanine(527)-N(7))-methyltransferase RsmG [Blastocatellia bacterium]|nr:16S rRNA (guanine(527)-N(7))-methyltransferase RsmG [Blastocatellia bacterium]